MDRPMKISETPAGCNPMDFEDEDDLTEYDLIKNEIQLSLPFPVKELSE